MTNTSPPTQLSFRLYVTEYTKLLVYHIVAHATKFSHLENFTLQVSQTKIMHFMTSGFICWFRFFETAYHMTKPSLANMLYFGRGERLCMTEDIDFI